MCIIVDANKASDLAADPKNEDSAPVLKWLTGGNGILVYGGKLSEELARVNKFARLLGQLARAGRTRLFDEALIEAERKALEALSIASSNDLHVLALARVSGARLLYTSDKKLIKDFKNRNCIPSPKGRVYRKANHSNLLTPKTCKKMCS